MKFGRKSADRRDAEDRREPSAEEWLSEFRPVRPEKLTAADRDAAAAERARPQRQHQPDGRFRDREQTDRDRGWPSAPPPRPDGRTQQPRPYPGQDYPGQQARPPADQQARPPAARWPPGQEHYPDRPDGAGPASHGRPQQAPYESQHRGYPGPGQDRRPGSAADYRGPRTDPRQRRDREPDWGPRAESQRSYGPPDAPRPRPQPAYPAHPARDDRPPEYWTADHHVLDQHDNGHGDRDRRPGQDRSQDRPFRPEPDRRRIELPDWQDPAPRPDPGGPPEDEPSRGQFRDYRRGRDNRLAGRDVSAARQPSEDHHYGGPAREPAASWRPHPEPGGTSRASYPGFTADLPVSREPAVSAARADPEPVAPPRSEQVSIAAVTYPAAERDEDSEPTNPLPVILAGATTLPGAAALPRPEPVAAPRGFFEAARPTEAPPRPRPFSVSGAVDPPSAEYATDPDAPISGPARVIPEAASAKLEQIKDLYLTAEAIGEEALDKHFEQVSERQRQLIREFFNQTGPGAETRP